MLVSQRLDLDAVVSKRDHKPLPLGAGSLCKQILDGASCPVFPTSSHGRL
jgi:hypothetical protein